MQFKVKDSNIFPMPGNPHMLHLGTISYGLREFIVMLCIAEGPYYQRCYIEEVVLNSIDYGKDVFAYCKFIADDNLAHDLTRFAEEHKLTSIGDRANQLIDSRKEHLLCLPLIGGPRGGKP
jgi:hypothetical protein